MNSNKSISAYLGGIKGLKSENYIEIYPKINDRINGTHTLYARASATYLMYDGQVLAMRQTKSYTPVPDKFVGIGGKEEIIIDKNPCGEFVELGKVFKAKSENVLGHLDMKLSAIREVEEETTDYFEDEEGNTQILRNGLKMDYDRLDFIGKSHTRIIKPDKTVSWEIDSFMYRLNEDEISQLSNLSLTNREGFFTWIDERELLEGLTISDCAIFMNKNPKSVTYEIRDNINDCNVFQYENSDEQSLITFYNREFLSDFDLLQLQTNEICQE